MSNVNGCAICDTDRRPVVDALLQSGTTFNAIETRMRELGAPTKRETVKRHYQRCLHSVRENGMNPMDGNDLPARSDFAVAVRDEAMKMLRAGKLKVATRDGINAQALLDRRAEKAQDRTLLVNMARLLSGSGRDVPEDIIGEVVILAPEEDEVPLALTGP